MVKDRRIKVLVIDDSALVRKVLTSILAKDPAIEVVGTANDPIFAIKKIKALRPDVLTLDLEMPRMDGLTFLEKLMNVFPMSVIVVSSLAKKSSMPTIRALELGAIDFVTKPEVGIGGGLEELSSEIIYKVKQAASANMGELQRQARKNKQKRPHKVGDTSEQSKHSSAALVKSTDKIIAIGASTGGTVAIKKILSELPANLPGILIVLHMPAGFTASYAESLNSTCRLKVKEASDRDLVQSGYAYVSPGGKHLLLTKEAKGYVIRIEDGPPVNRHRPSVDKTLFSVAKVSSPNSMGIILTGMGDDGAKGLKEMHDKGSYTVVQNEETSIVFGMPKQAIALGGVDKVLPIEEISKQITGYVN